MSLLRALLVLLIPIALIGGGPTGGDDDDAVSDCTADNRPTLSIGSPETGAVYDSGDDINWSVTITDPDTDAADLLISVLDVTGSTAEDLDIDVPVPGATGLSSFSMAADLLESGAATPVRILVEDPDGCSVNDQILICVDYDEPPCNP